MEKTLGKYRIEGLVAEGGMARIYRARTEGVGGVEKTVGLKCLKGAMCDDDEMVQMLMDEARITAQMTHKNICQVYGLEHDADTYFMVMELVDGVNLADLSNYLFSANRVFPIEAAVFIAMEVCAGLNYAHRMTDDQGESLGIVHRDVNPQNICISKAGEVKLIDFGIAKARCERVQTQAGTIKGKFNYMSPEQARGERVDQRTDVFALGAVLYEMLCGHMLYPLTLDDARLRSKTRMAEYVPIESYLPDIPEKMRKIIAKALARDINQRFATSRDFLLALTQFFHDSCKVYDSLNLSMLVERYLSTKGEGATGNRVSKSSAEFAKVSRNDEKSDDYALNSGDTAVMNAIDAHRIATGAMPDDDEGCATSVYQQPNFSKPSSDSSNLEARKEALIAEDLSLARSVDLDVVKVGTESTVMVKMDSVKTGLRARIASQISVISERTLMIIAIILGVLLAVAVIVFFHMSSQQPSGNSTSNADVSIDHAEETDVQ